MRDILNKLLRGTARVGLGLFVLWQVVFLAASFFIRVEESLREATASNCAYLNDNFPQIMKGEDAVHQQLATLQKQGLKRYGHATGQIESWSLFAPTVDDMFSFCTVELRWDDDRLEPGGWDPAALVPVLLRGINEPADLGSFLRYKDFRFRKYEAMLTPNPTHSDNHFDPKADNWRERIASYTDENGDNMVAYLRWRWRDYQNNQKRQGQDLPEPTQVILHMHGYRIPEPPGPTPWQYEDYGLHPVARWLPWKPDQTGARSLERYNPQTDRYESVP